MTSETLQPFVGTSGTKPVEGFVYQEKDDFFAFLEEIKAESEFFPNEEFVKKPRIRVSSSRQPEKRKKQIVSSAWRNAIVAEEVRKVRNRISKFETIDNLLSEDYMMRFDQAARKHGFKVRRLSDGRSVYRLGKGPVKMVFVSGIHGEERAGPIALLSWLELTKKGHLLPDHVTLMVCPLIGHNAWNERKRRDGRMNLNSVWYHRNDKGKKRPNCIRQLHYVQELKRTLIKFKPTVFVDFHEDSTIKDNEPYCFRRNTNKGLVYQMQEALGLSKKKAVWNYPEWAGTTETFISHVGCEQTTTIETPQTKPLKSRVGFNLAIIKWMLENSTPNQDATT